MTALTQKDMASAGCGMPDCNHDHSILYLHGRCHMGTGNEVAYEKATGILTVRCNKCKQFVAEILVAARPEAKVP